jgi:hypothetical protein
LSDELLRHGYLGALKVLAETAMHIDGRRAERLRRLIEREFKRAERLLPGFKWVRSVSHFVVWIEED